MNISADIIYVHGHHALDGPAAVKIEGYLFKENFEPIYINKFDGDEFGKGRYVRTKGEGGYPIRDKHY